MNLQNHAFKAFEDGNQDSKDGKHYDNEATQKALNKRYKASRSQRVIKDHSHSNRPREAFTTRQAADADIGQSEWYKQSDYEVLYQRSSTKRLSHAGPRKDDVSPGTQRPADEKGQRLRGVGTHLARIEDQEQHYDRARNREGQLLEASVHSSDARKQAQQNNPDGQRAQGGEASQGYSQAQSSHRILRQKKPARPSTSKTGQK